MSVQCCPILAVLYHIMSNSEYQYTVLVYIPVNLKIIGLLILLISGIDKLVRCGVYTSAFPLHEVTYILTYHMLSYYSY